MYLGFPKDQLAVHPHAVQPPQWLTASQPVMVWDACRSPKLSFQTVPTAAVTDPIDRCGPRVHEPHFSLCHSTSAMIPGGSGRQLERSQLHSGDGGHRQRHLPVPRTIPGSLSNPCYLPSLFSGCQRGQDATLRPLSTPIAPNPPGSCPHTELSSSLLRPAASSAHPPRQKPHLTSKLCKQGC